MDYYLIVSSGEFYQQFVLWEGNENIVCEIVGQKYLIDIQYTQYQKSFTASATAGEAFITLRNDEQTLFNSFLIDEFTDHYDDSTYSDTFELWKN